MKAILKKDLENAITLNAHGKTMAEKKCNVSQEFLMLMRPYAGKTIEIETEHLFEDQFNAAEPNARIMWTYVEKLILEPEFKNAQELIDAVQKQYDVKWPGTKVNPYFIKKLCGEG